MVVNDFLIRNWPNLHKAQDNQAPCRCKCFNVMGQGPISVFWTSIYLYCCMTAYNSLSSCSPTTNVVHGVIFCCSNGKSEIPINNYWHYYYLGSGQSRQPCKEMQKRPKDLSSDKNKLRRHTILHPYHYKNHHNEVSMADYNTLLVDFISRYWHTHQIRQISSDLESIELSK